MILLRTHVVDDATEALADELAALSGLEVVYVVDERRGALDTRGRPKIGVTAAACEALGLYCPDDFAWRCGDYGFYLARSRFPSVDHFWLIENDARLEGTNPARFFEFFAEDPADLLATYIERPPATWAWIASVESNDRPAWKCFFPVVRMSARAIDLLHGKRREHARQWSRRVTWANDEGFVATTALNSELVCADLNREGAVFYDQELFHFETVHDAKALPPVAAEARLLHSVLEGEALARKRARLVARTDHSPSWARLKRRIARRIGPGVLARYMNRRRAW